MTSQIGDGWQLIGPLVAPGQIQAWVASATLQCNLDMASQHLDFLYKANADPTALSEAVVHAREACIRLEHSMHFKQAGFSGVHPPHEWANQGSDHNHPLGVNNAPRQPVYTHALLPALSVDPIMPEQAFPHQPPIKSYTSMILHNQHLCNYPCSSQ
jgi:hypothetical protein